jgi:predicted acylesterase/phospholipase RssA
MDRPWRLRPVLLQAVFRSGDVAEAEKLAGEKHMAYRTLTRDEHFQLPGPKRILALDGGGLRGILSLGFLSRIEALLRGRHGAPDLRLSHYFDLIAGTSTGAIIAAALAKGLTVEEITRLYLTLGHDVFKRSWFRQGVLRARYDEAKLAEQLQRVLGKETTLGSDSLETGLLIVTKRLDTGSPWPIGNNPRGKYFQAPPEADWISNRDYPLWKVVRASTAAPSYFDPEEIVISERPGRKSVVGSFVDGGVSPFNNPALQALMYTTLDGFRVKWQTGAENLLIVSIGTGVSDPSRTPAKLAAEGAIKALLALMDDSAALVETMMQWMSMSARARVIDREIGDLRQDLIGPTPQFSYLRYNLTLTRDAIEPIKGGLSDGEIEALSAMDDPGRLETLRELGLLAAAQQVQDADFPPRFDLPI